MKNIHLLPTDKPSRLYKSIDNELSFTDIKFEQTNNFNTNQHIYITSDEEIKDGDLGTDGTLLGYYGFDGDGCPILKNTKNNTVYEFGLAPHAKKIILTTDQDLIAEGVQEIYDEFLEWFVKNPSCEEVETHIVKLCTNCGQQYCDNRDCRGYNGESEYLISYPENTTQEIITYCDGYEVNTEKIIIPKEEPNYNMKQEILAEMERLEEETKQETLEEVAERVLANNIDGLKDALQDDDLFFFYKGVIQCYGEAMAKWQEKRSYSEEEVLDILVKAMKEVKVKRLTFFDGGSEYPIYSNLSKWFERFKKK